MKSFTYAKKISDPKLPIPGQASPIKISLKPQASSHINSCIFVTKTHLL